MFGGHFSPLVVVNSSVTLLVLLSISYFCVRPWVKAQGDGLVRDDACGTQFLNTQYSILAIVKYSLRLMPRSLLHLLIHFLSLFLSSFHCDNPNDCIFTRVKLHAEDSKLRIRNHRKYTFNLTSQAVASLLRNATLGFSLPFSNLEILA